MTEVRRYLLEGCPNHDTCWDLIGSPDGYIYVGACMEHTPGGIAELVQFNSRNENLRYIAKMDELTNERYGDTHAPQGKIHLSLSPTKEGVVYGSTHCTTPPLMDKMWDPWAIFMHDKKYFKGAHLYRYEPKPDEITDFGIVTPNEGVSVMILDEDVERLFAATFPRAHMYSWNLKGRDIIDFGRVSEHYILSLAKYDKDTIFFTDYYGRLMSVNSQKMSIEDRYVQLFHPSYGNGMRNWMAHSVVSPDGWVYAGMYSYPNLIRFRPFGDRIIAEDLGSVDVSDKKDPALDFAFTYGMPVGLIQSGEKIYFVQLVYFGPKEFMGSYIAFYDSKSGDKGLVSRLELEGFKPLVWRGALGIDGRLYWADFDATPPSLWSIVV